MDRAMDRLLAYTRVPIPDEYAPDLAYSIHFALIGHDGEVTYLNRNYGVLFAEAKISPDNLIIPSSAVKPHLFRTTDGRIGIEAVQVRTDGSDDAETHGKILFWTLDDSGDFSASMPIDLQRDAVPAVQSETYGIDGAVPGNTIPITPEESEALRTRWTQVRQVGVRIPVSVTASCTADIEGIRAELLYSDGSSAPRDIEWNMGNISFYTPGTYRITGCIRPVMQAFPLAPGFADPVILHRDGRYYFVASNDNTDTHGLYACASDTLEGLFSPDNPMREILPVDESRGLIQNFWAPELHEIGGSLYLLFAVSAVKNRIPQPQCHMMRLGPGGDLLDPASWEDPVRVLRVDGSPLSATGITLDMTYIKTPRASYLVWSSREHFTTPLDTGSILCIATTDPARPWVLTCDPVVLSRPLFGWENIERTINNEAPYPLIHDGKLWLAYSAGSAGAYSYAIGWLTADIAADLMDLGSWHKASSPALSYYSVPGIYGPGHNAFFVDKTGDTMLVYHAGTARHRYKRSTGIRRVHFGRSGRPLLDLDAERDLDPRLQEVSMDVIVEA